jgi:hypothetical protein
MMSSRDRKGNVMNAIRRISVAAAIVVAISASACADDTTSGDKASTSAELPQGAQAVELDPADFVDTIDHPYWPMKPGTTWVYNELETDARLKVEVTVTNDTKDVGGIQATVVHDVVTEDGEVIEDTFDWYGQDRDGNLWYLGEDTKEFENGKVVSTEGSWEHGVDGAQAGIILPAEPRVGMEYRQEYYEGEAEDLGAILSLDEWVETPSGKYRNVLMTKDWTPLEPDVLEHKFYARGVGPVLALGISGGAGREELVRFSGS